jgi:hypothetical protein
MGFVNISLWLIRLCLGFWQTGTLKVPAAAFSEELKLYGFVYFFLSGLSWKILGFGIFQFRLVNLLMGIAVVWQTYNILKINSLATKNPLLYYLFIVLMLTDPFFYLCLHEGRMDLTAVFWTLLGIRFTLQNFQNPKISTTIYIALFFALAMLTTPRVGFMILAIALVILYWLGQNLRQRWHLALWGFGAGVFFYSLWIFYAYGSWGNFFHYFFSASVPINRQGTAISEYVGSIGYIPRQEYPLIGLAIIAFLLGIWQQKWAYFQPLIVIILGSLLFFYTLVLDLGPSSAYILPFYYLLIFNTLARFPFNYKNPILILSLGLLLFNGAYFGAKNGQVLASLAQRDYQVADNFVKQYIPRHSRVISEPMFFYSVEKNQSHFQMMDEYETLVKREQLQREVFDYQYFIVSDHLKWRKPELVDYYFQKSKLIKIARLDLPPSPTSIWIDNLRLLSTTERTGYSCTIYRRVK